MAFVNFGVLVLTLYFSSLIVNAVDMSEADLTKVVQKLDILLDRKIGGKLSEIDKRMNQMSGAISKLNSEVASLKERKKKMKLPIIQNSSDLEERVSELETQMFVVEDEISDMKLGLSAIADSVDELQEAENVQDENILFLAQEVDQIEDDADALEDRVDSNEDVLNLYGEQLGVHENSITLLEEQVNVLEVTDSSMQERLDAIEAADMITDNRLDNLSDQVAELENTTASQQTDIDNLMIADDAHDSDIDALQDVDSGLEERVAELEQGSGTNNISIGFNARLTNNDIPDAGDPILYQNVMVNKGNCYSADTGIFTAEIAGLYYFQQYWIMSSGQEQYLRIMKNGVEQCTSVGDADASGDYNSPSCSAAMELIPGDQVYVTSWGLNVGCYTCTGFTGFLIQAY